jgi:hypothetical protein
MRHLLAVSAAVALALALPLSTQGCAETACFVYTDAEIAAHGNSCPSAAEALASFADPRCPGKVVSVDGAGEYTPDAQKPGQGLCCYPVTQRQIELDPNRTDCPDPNACSSCADLLDGTVDLSQLCAADRAAWDSIVTCVCAPGSVCEASCAFDACQGATPSAECEGCLLGFPSDCSDPITTCSIPSH